MAISKYVRKVSNACSSVMSTKEQGVGGDKAVDSSVDRCDDQRRERSGSAGGGSRRTAPSSRVIEAR